MHRKTFVALALFACLAVPALAQPAASPDKQAPSSAASATPDAAKAPTGQ